MRPDRSIMREKALIVSEIAVRSVVDDVSDSLINRLEAVGIVVRVQRSVSEMLAATLVEICIGGRENHELECSKIIKDTGEKRLELERR